MFHWITRTTSGRDSLITPTSEWLKLTTPKTARHNEGHSEYQLLHGNGLDAMIERLSNCSQFMIIYSTHLPCMRPRYPNGNLVPGKPDRCLEMIGAAKTQLLNDCPNTFVYLYTHQAAARSNSVKDQNFSNGKTIIYQ